MTRNDRHEWFQNWMTRRVRGVLDGLSLAHSGLDELVFEARRPGTTIDAATRGELEDLMGRIAEIRGRVRAVSPLPIAEEE